MKRAFTLVELLVSVAVFSVVSVLVAGAYLTMIAVNRQTQATATASDNLAFVLENMTRTIRTGDQYSCGSSPNLGDCAAGASSFTFVDAGGRTIIFALSNGGITEAVGGVTSTLTDPSITISNLTFIVNGTSKTDQREETVKILITGTTPGISKGTLTFHVETMATSRDIDL